MFVLTSHITVGAYTFTGVNELRIKRGIHSYVDTASIKLPTSSRLKQANAASQTIDTAKKFNRGDKVIIKLGYNGKLLTEFVGFVARVNFTSPCELECEGYSFQLRTNNINKTFAQGTSVREVCEYIIKGTNITLSNAIPKMNLGSALRVTNETGAKVLDYLKDNFKYTVYFNGPALYVGLEETEPKGTTKYKLGFNTIKDNGLKYHITEQTRIKVVLKTANTEGGKAVYTTGDADGEVHEYIVKHAAKHDLRDLAEGYLKQYKFTGYDGSITAFLQPYCEHGYTAIVTDSRYPERDGSYFVPSVEVSFGSSGARRIVELSKKIST